MLEEKKHLCMNPLDLWQSESVYLLLRDFFAINFAEASLPESIAHDFVDTAWNMKQQTSDYDAVRLACNEIFIRNQKKATRPTENDPLNIIDLSDIKSFADIGANKLGAVNYYMRKFPNIEKFYAVDIVPQCSHFHDSTKGTYIVVSPTATEIPLPHGEKVDCVHFRFSLHHFESLALIRQAFANAHAILNEGGRLILWEETFSETLSDAEMGENNVVHGIKTDSLLSRRFYDLSTQERWEFVIANDWLVNVNNAHMPWTGQHYTFEEWTQILDESGFTLSRSYNLGLRASGRLKQGVHMCGIFTKK